MNTVRCPLLFACLLGMTLHALAFAPGEVSSRIPSGVPVGGLLSDAPMRGLNGPSASLAQFRGTPLLINVWASWCGPCQAEMASLERLAWLDLPVRFRIIGISTDDDENAAKALLGRSNATLSHFIDERRVLENLLGASRLPLTLLVDADGRVLQKIVGARQWDSPESVQLITSRLSPAKGGSVRR